jgi:glycosyltransferase involved in cell wall biosynthesis
MSADRSTRRGVFLSIIVPAHNETRRLPATLTKILGFLDGRDYLYEVIIVENGSTDGTFALAASLAERNEFVRVFQEKRRGKGLAVRRGMLEAVGEYRFLCDADLSMPIEEIVRFLPPALDDFDVAIGSREAPGAQVIDEPLRRRRMGRMFNRLVRATVLPGLRDTQCGFKCFRADAAREIFSRARLDGMAFDVEALYLARRLGFRIVEIPIPWQFDADSRVRALRDSLQMAGDLLRIRFNNAIGRYRTRMDFHP